MERITCFKCGSSRAWIETTRTGLVERCQCGVCRPVIRRSGNTTTMSAVRPSEVTLPQKGTKTRRCLFALVHHYPRQLNTSQVAKSTWLENKETSALLTTLMARGLVERVSERRGLVGGSEWKLSHTAITIIKPKEG